MLILDELELYQHYLEEELEYEVKQISLDEYLFCVDGKVRVRYTNCSKVSEEFLRYCLISDIAFILEDGYEEFQEEIRLNAEELLEEWIREGIWDWKKEVKERYHIHFSLNTHTRVFFLSRCRPKNPVFLIISYFFKNVKCPLPIQTLLPYI